MRQVIFTADDFGLDEAVNEAVERGHREGVLSCASLMVAAPAAADAVARARALPRLRVGLHLVLVDGQPALPASQVPALVDANGRFPNQLAAAGLGWFFRLSARRQLADEIRAQFEAFRATGLAIDHVNAHHHMHIHPTVLSLVLDMAGEYGVRHIRLPHEPPDLAEMPSGFGQKLAETALAPWTAMMRRRLRKAGFGHNDVLIGLRASGRMTEDRILAQIERLPDGISEIYCHPTTAPPATAEAGDRRGELAALLSPRVAQALHRTGLVPKGFSDLD